MDYHFTDADMEYRAICEAIGEIYSPETSLEILLFIKMFEEAYPAYYKSTLLRMKYLDAIDNMERLETIC
jgi:hypothetical protein|tara:strand:+ start:1125 stop:1334 length:210 start_codon:yes stop_codon:yes gene_type:complete